MSSRYIPEEFHPTGKSGALHFGCMGKCRRAWRMLTCAEHGRERRESVCETCRRVRENNVLRCPWCGGDAGWAHDGFKVGLLDSSRKVEVYTDGEDDDAR